MNHLAQESLVLDNVVACPEFCEFNWAHFHGDLDTALAHFIEETTATPSGVSLMDFIRYSYAKREVAAA